MTDYPVLIASSDLRNRQALRAILIQHGLDPICSSTVQETRETLAKLPVSIVFCERQLADGSFRDLLKTAKQARPEVFVVVTSRTGNSDEYFEAKRLGAFEVISSPCHPTDGGWVVIRAMPEWRQNKMNA